MQYVIEDMLVNSILWVIEMSLVSRCDCAKVKLYVIRFNEDSPKRSTALKLVRLGLVRKIGLDHRFKNRVILLDPFAGKTLSPEDCPLQGIVVVDRSWNRLLEDRRVPSPRGKVARRRLPPARAANPVNFSKPNMLSSAEALAWALITLGCVDRAMDILGKFKWGRMFVQINTTLINLDE